MRYHRNNLFLPTLILSATRHIHEPITNLIHKAKTSTNDILQAGSIGMSTSMLHATQDSLQVITTTTIPPIPPGLDELESTQTPALHHNNPDNISIIELVGPLPPSTIHNVPNFCVSQAAPSPELLVSAQETSTEMCGPVELELGSSEAGWNALREYSHTCPLGEVGEMREATDVERDEWNVHRFLDVENHRTVVYRTVDPYIRALSTLREQTLNSSNLVLSMIFDHESLAEIIPLLAQGESITRSADKTTLSHVNIMANFIHVIFCAGWYVPWRGRPTSRITIWEARRNSAHPFSVCITERNREYDRVEQSRYLLSSRVDRFFSSVLPPGWTDLLLDNGPQPLGQSILRLFLRFIYTATLFALRVPENFPLACICVIYCAISGTHIAIKASLVDTWNTFIGQCHAAVGSVKACVSILCSIAYKCTHRKRDPLDTNNETRSREDRVELQHSVDSHLYVTPPTSFDDGIPSGTGIEIDHLDIGIAVQPSSQTGMAIIPTTIVTTASSIASTEFEGHTSDSRKTCKECNVVDVAQRCIRSCESLKTADTGSLLNLSFRDDLTNYYQSGADRFSDHSCSSVIKWFSPLCSKADDEGDLSLHLEEITKADEHMSRLLEEYCSSPLPVDENYSDDMSLMYQLHKEQDMSPLSRISTLSSGPSDEELEVTLLEDNGEADIASFAKIAFSLYHEYSENNWS